MFHLNIRRRLDSNRGSLVSEATALPTEQQPLPYLEGSSYAKRQRMCKLEDCRLEQWRGKSDSAIGPGFDSSHRQLFRECTYLLLSLCRKDQHKEKRPVMAQFDMACINQVIYLLRCVSGLARCQFSAEHRSKVEPRAQGIVFLTEHSGFWTLLRLSPDFDPIPFSTEQTLIVSGICLKSILLLLFPFR